MKKNQPRMEAEETGAGSKEGPNEQKNHRDREGNSIQKRKFI